MNSLDSEVWVDVIGHPGYMVSNLGRVKSLDRILDCGIAGKQQRYGRVLSPNRAKTGYFDIQLGAKARYLVHRLVALHFCDGYFDGAHVNHKDGNKTNNVASNLEWVTMAENSRHAIRVLGKRPAPRFGAENSRSKRVRCVECATGRVIHEFGGAREAARELGINYQSITASARGVRRKPTKTRWEYVS